MSSLFERACRREVTPRPPIWVMRQAGRYLPEYRAVRAKTDFLTLCRTPELAAEVTLQPIERFGFDASIVFSDIMMPLESMGVRLEFNPGPVVLNPIRSVADVAALRLPEADEIAPFVMQTLRLLRRALGDRTPVIGFAGAPLTLAAYLIEGKGSKDFARLRAFLYAEPVAAHALFDRLGDAMARYLCAQVEAGAQAVQLFDSWAGLLSERDYRRFALPAVQKIMTALKPYNVPRIFFAQDAAALFPCLKESGADVYGIDWRTDLRDARTMLGADVALQGNLDPAILHASVDVVRAETRRVLDSAGTAPGYIFNLGHGILPETPLDRVSAMIDVVRGT